MTAVDFEKRGSAIHGILFFAIWILVTFSLPIISWPLYLLLPLLIYGGIVLAIKPLRRTVPKLAIGKLHGQPLACAAILALTTAGVLVAFQALIEPDVSELAARIPVHWFGNLALAGVCFSVVNAVLEELIFRGVLWEVVAEEWNRGVALGVTAFLFGVSHLNGYPPGALGAVLAGVYGILFGALRWWSGGLGLVAACHVCADAAIFCILEC